MGRFDWLEIEVAKTQKPAEENVVAEKRNLRKLVP